MRLFKQKSSKSEISQYVSDLKDINMLRATAFQDSSPEEVQRYNTMIKVMQEIVIRLSGKVR